MTQIKRLKDKYLPLFLGLLLLSFCATAQTYNPSVCCTVSNKAYGAAQSVSTDGRSWFYDATNFVMRDYNGTTEVFSYLNLPKYRSGHFPIFVHSGGILQGNGVWLGGITQVYWFKDSTGNANLVRWYTDSTGTPGGPFFAVANNLSEGNAGLIKGNLALDNVDNTSDAQKNAASVSLTNHTIDANNNNLLHIPNSALTNTSIGLTLTATGSDVTVPVTPAALGTSLTINIPTSAGSVRGVVTGTDWTSFHGKVDSTSQSNDTVYDWHNGTAFFRYVIGGGGAGITSLNGLTTSTQFFTPGTSGSDFNIVSSVATHTFNFPNGSASNRGLIIPADWTAFNAKEPPISASNTIDQYWNGYKQFVPLNSDSVQEGSAHLFFTNARARGAISLTTSGSSGVATYNSSTGVLNVPNYSGGSGVTSITAGSGLLGGTVTSTGTFKLDTSLAVTQLALKDSSNFFDYNYYGGFFPSGDTVIPFGHSYVFGVNATIPALRYSSVFCNSIGAVELNMGVSGSTVMTQNPVDYQGARSFVERMTSIPPYTFNHKFIWFDGGLNDAGQTAPDYTTLNYMAAWDSVMNYVINTLGYPKRRVAILGVEFIGQTGLDYYGSITGNASPTYARMRQFDSCNKATALKWGTLFVPMYDKMLFNDTTLLGGTGTVHPTDSGYAYMANLMLQKTGLSVSSPFIQSGNNITSKVINSNVILGTQSGAGVTTPNFLSLGGQFSSSAASPGKAKLKFYDDGIPNNTFGFGISASSFEYFGGGAGTSHLFYINGDATPYMKITPTGVVVPHSGAASVTIGDHTIASSLLIGDHTLTSTATPGVVDAGGTFSNSAGDSSKAKIITYTNGTSYAGLGFSLSGLEYYAPYTTPHQFYYRNAVRFQIGDSTLITNVHPGNASMALMVYNRSSSAIDTVPASTFGGGTNIYNTDGSLTGNRTLSVNGNSLTITGSTGVATGLVINSAFYLSNSGIADADLTIDDSKSYYDLNPSITAGRTITLPNPATSNDFGRILVIHCPVTSFAWSFSTTVSWPDGATVIATLKPNTFYTLMATSAGWTAINVSSDADRLRSEYIISTPSTGGTVALVSNKMNIVNPSGSLATLTLTFPAGTKGDVIKIKFDQSVAAVTYSGSTVAGQITAPVLGAYLEFTWDSVSSTWF